MKIKIYSIDDKLYDNLIEFKPDKKIDYIEINCDKCDDVLLITHNYFEEFDIDIRLVFVDIELMKIYPVRYS